MSIITFSPSSAIKNVCLVATTTGQIELRSIADGDLEKGFKSLISNEVLFYIPKFYMGMFARNIKMLWDHAKQEHDNKTSNPLTLTFGAKGTLEGKIIIKTCIKTSKANFFFLRRKGCDNGILHGSSYSFYLAHRPKTTNCLYRR